MPALSRRKWMITAAGATGVTAGTGLAARNGLLPPDCAGPFGVGDSLTYAAQRLLTGQAMAREFSRDQISAKPFANGVAPPTEDYKRLQAGGFADWRVAVDGLVSRPGSYSLADLRNYPASTQITQLVCEEGWSYVAEWTGVPVFRILEAAGALPHARFVVHHSMEQGWTDSIDMADALHPQTLLAYGMNGGDLPPGHGGPLRLRVPRQLGYKSVKFIERLTVTGNLDANPAGGGYSWFAGI